MTPKSVGCFRIGAPTCVLMLLFALSGLGQERHISVVVDCWNDGACPLLSSVSPGEYTTDYTLFANPYQVGWQTGCTFADPVPAGAIVTKVVASAEGLWDTAVKYNDYSGYSVVEPVQISIGGTSLTDGLDGGSAIAPFGIVWCDYAGAYPYCPGSLTWDPQCDTDAIGEYPDGFPGWNYGGINNLSIGGPGATPPDSYGDNVGGYVSLEAVKLDITYRKAVFLDVNADFDPAQPIDDLPYYIPGTNVFPNSPVTQTNVPLPQQVKLHVVLPDITGKGSATFEIRDVSNFPGRAMNLPIEGADDLDDIYFMGRKGPTRTTNVSFSNGHAEADLHVDDRAARGTIDVTVKVGKKTYGPISYSIPLDQDANGLPDAGWYSANGWVDPTGLTADIDGDEMDETGPGGDGLSAFEEYRGFSTGGGTFTRLDPRKRDVFLAADNLLLLNTQFMNMLLHYQDDSGETKPVPLTIHYVTLDEVLGETYEPRMLEGVRPIIDPNRSGIPGASENGQRAVRLIFQDQHYPMHRPLGGGEPVEVWKLGIFGMTIRDGQNLTEVDDDDLSNPILTKWQPHTPNMTKAVEVYDKTFRNFSMFTLFDLDPDRVYRDKLGNPVPFCPSPLVPQGEPGYVDPETCDVKSTVVGGGAVDNLISAYVLSNGVRVLHTVTEEDWEFYTKTVTECTPASPVVRLNEDEMALLRSLTPLHEFGHALKLDHSNKCGGQLMFENKQMYRAMSDVLPLPTGFDQENVDGFALWGDF